MSERFTRFNEHINLHKICLLVAMPFARLQREWQKQCTYYSLIDSQLRNGIQGLCNSSTVQVVIVHQKRVMRILFQLNCRDSYKPFFKHHKI